MSNESLVEQLRAFEGSVSPRQWDVIEDAIEALTPLSEQALLGIANEYDQGNGANFEFDKATLLALLRRVSGGM